MQAALHTHTPINTHTIRSDCADNLKLNIFAALLIKAFGKMDLSASSDLLRDSWYYHCCFFINAVDHCARASISARMTHTHTHNRNFWCLKHYYALILPLCSQSLQKSCIDAVAEAEIHGVWDVHIITPLSLSRDFKKTLPSASCRFWKKKKMTQQPENARLNNLLKQGKKKNRQF